VNGMRKLVVLEKFSFGRELHKSSYPERGEFVLIWQKVVLIFLLLCGMVCAKVYM